MSYAERMAELRWEDLPGAVQSRAKLCLKDLLGVAAGGLCLDGPAALRSFVRTQFAPGAIRLWFQDVGSSLAGAAYHNAMLVDFLDAHDGFRPAKGHAGATVIPVALACATDDTSGARLLTAIVLAYELACRAGLAVHALYTPAYHASGSWAALGAAAAGASLWDIEPSRWDAILGTAEYYAPVSPMLRCIAHPAPVKDAAGAGALAASMALGLYAHGITGPPSLFTTEAVGRAQAETLGEDWLILRQYFKPYPTCRWTHPAVEGAWALQRAHRFFTEEICSVDVETFEAATCAVRFPPRDTHEAQYSLPWALAAALTDGELGAAQICETRLEDPRVLALGRRVRAQVAEDLERCFPEMCAARVSIALKDGRCFTGPTLRARGDPDHPLSEEELEAKYFAYTTPTLGIERAQALGDVITTLERRDAGDLFALL